MNDLDFDEYAKPRKIRKQKVHRQPVFFDDDVDEVRNRKQAGKKKSSRHVDDDFEDEDLTAYKAYLK